MKLTPQVIAAFVVALMLAACGGPQPDPAQGEENFKTAREVGMVGPATCAACHSLGEKRPGDGPPLSDIKENAATRVEGMSAEEYVRQSIIDPSAHVEEGYFDNLMPKVYGELLTEEEIDHLIAFLLAQ